MKKVLIGICLVFASATAIACTTETKDKVPQVVKDALAKKFPTAKKVDWEKENKNEWEAEFKLNEVEYSANFLEDGTWRETEHKIDKKDVPQNVILSLESTFPGYKIEEAEISETAEGMFYEFEIEKGKSEIEVTINTFGKVIKKQTDKDKEDED